MIDKQLLRLLGSSRKYIFFTVASMAVGLLANLAITSGICWAISLLAAGTEASAYIAPAICGAVGIAVRYAAGRTTGYLKDLLGRKAKKDLREKTYDKIVRLGVRSTDGMSIAGLTQVAMEGIEQLDLYYSSYIPQFFFAMLAPLILFGVTAGIDAKVAVVLLCCVPLIPVSIIAVSKYAKKIFAKYWGKYTSMGDSFLDSVQGLRELKIFRADAARHEKMNQNAEEFRKITMKVLVMQLASTTIMDIVAYGGAGVGIAIAVSDAANSAITPVAALFLILVAVDFFLPLRAFGSAFHIAMNGASAGRKILSLLEQPDPVWGGETLTKSGLKLDNITFSYDGSRYSEKCQHGSPEQRNDRDSRRKRLRKVYRCRTAYGGAPPRFGQSYRWRKGARNPLAGGVLLKTCGGKLQHICFQHHRPREFHACKKGRNGRRDDVRPRKGEPCGFHPRKRRA